MKIIYVCVTKMKRLKNTLIYVTNFFPNVDDRKIEYEKNFVAENYDKLHGAKAFVRKFKY